MRKFNASNNILKITGAALLAAAGVAVHAAGPDWSLIISGPGIVIPAMPNLVAPAPVQAAPVPAASAARVAPVVVAPQPVPLPQVNSAGVQGYRPDLGWERDRDRQFHDRFQERFQERENYWLERERAFISREKAFLEREKQRQLVVENNMKASQFINDRQDEQLNQIVEGVNLGRIDRDEFAGLMAQQKAVRDRERAFLADGFMAQDEYNALTTDLNNAEQAIRFAARPDRPRREGRDGQRYFYQQQFPQNR